MKYPLEVTVIRSDGTPAAGATITLLRLYGEGEATASSLADTRGVATLQAAEELFRVIAWLGNEANTSEELVAPKDRGKITIRLGPAVVVHGVVLFEGEPEEGKRVTLTACPWYGSELGFELTAESGPDGRFAMAPLPQAGLESAGSFTLDVDGKTTSVAHVHVDVETVRRGDEIRVDLRLEYSVRVRFVSPSGAPVAIRTYGGAGGLHTDVGLTPDEEATGTLLIRWLEPGRTARLVAMDGRGLLSDSPESGFRWKNRWFVGKSLGTFDGRDGDVDLGDVVFRPGRPVAGTVVDGAGRPAAGAVVRLLLDGTQLGCIVADANGHFVLPEVGADSHRVVVDERLPEGSTDIARTKVADGVKGGDPDVRIVLDDVLALVLHLFTAADRRPVECAQYSIRVKIHGEGFDWYGYDNAGDPQESFTFEVLRPGSYDVEVRIPGFEPMKFESVEVLPNRPASLDLLLRKRTD